MNPKTNNRQTRSQNSGQTSKPDDNAHDLHPKGAMREPPQTPDADQSEWNETREALQELEEKEGDWSKGG